MNLGDLAGRLGVHLAELMAPVAVGFGIGCLRQALARLKEQRFRQLAWEAMIYAERRFASGPERLDYVSRYLARRTGLQSMSSPGGPYFRKSSKSLFVLMRCSSGAETMR